MKLSDLTQPQTIDNSQPKLKLSDVVKQNTMASNRINPSMQGGANAPALVKAREDVESAKSRTNPIMTTLKGLSDTTDQINKMAPFGDRKMPMTPRNIAGEGLKAASFIPGVGPVVGGAAYMAGSGVEDKNKSAGGVALQAGLGAVGGGAFRLGTGIAKGVGKFIPDTIKRSASDYLNSSVIPKAVETFKGVVQKGNDAFHAMLEKKGIIPKSASNTLKQFGEDDIKATHDKYMGSTDPILNRVQQAIKQKEMAANKAYSDALSSAPEGKSIDIKPSIEEAGKKLKKLGLISSNGKLTELGQSEIAKDSTYGKLLDFYKSADSISGVKAIKAKAGITARDSIAGKGGSDLTINQGSKLIKSRFETLVNKDQYTFLRDKLNDLYRGKPSDIDVGKVVDKFYENGESSGIKGLQNARKLSREHFNFEDKYLNRSTGDIKGINEKSLDRYHSLPEQTKRNLLDIEKYTGQKFVDDLRKVTAHKHLDSITEKIGSLIKRAENPKETTKSLDELKSIVGEDNAKKIMREVVAHRQTKLVGRIASGTVKGGAIFEGGKKLLTGSF